MRFTVAIVASAIAVAGCQKTPEEAAYDNYQEAMKEITFDTAVAQARARNAVRQAHNTAPAGEAVNVASDPRAQYWILSKTKMPNGHLEVLSRRVGPSGESYARREVDCDARTVRYIGEGDTLEEAKADAPNPGRMTEPVWESITGVITDRACKS